MGGSVNCCNGDCQQGRRCPYNKQCPSRVGDLLIAVALVAIIIAVSYLIAIL